MPVICLEPFSSNAVMNVHHWGAVAGLLGRWRRTVLDLPSSSSASLAVLQFLLKTFMSFVSSVISVNERWASMLRVRICRDWKDKNKLSTCMKVDLIIFRSWEHKQCDSIKTLTLLWEDMSWVVLGDVLGAQVAHASCHACVKVRWRGDHGGMWYEGRQVRMGRWRRMVERRMPPWVEIWLLR